MWALGLITWSTKQAERVDVVVGSKIQWKHHPVLRLTRRGEEVQRWSSHESGGMKLRHVEADVWLKVPPKGWREKSQLNSNCNPSANYQVQTCCGNGIPFPKDYWKKNFDVGFFCFKSYSRSNIILVNPDPLIKWSKFHSRPSTFLIEVSYLLGAVRWFKKIPFNVWLVITCLEECSWYG